VTCSAQVQQYAERLVDANGSSDSPSALTWPKTSRGSAVTWKTPTVPTQMGLAALRQAADLTQVELAKKLGVSQAAVSRIEQPDDLLLSTLNAYLQAVGGNARVIVQFADGHEVDLDLSALTATRGKLVLAAHAPGH
jgi:DNA-binding transcriptional regulator YiaG